MDIMNIMKCFVPKMCNYRNVDITCYIIHVMNIYNSPYILNTKHL